MKKNKSSNVFFAMVIFGLLSSCGIDNKDFSRKENKIIDSLYNVRLNEYKGKLDTLCDSVYHAEYPGMVDSIKEVRKREILDLIGK